MLLAVAWDIVNEIHGDRTIDQRLQGWSMHFPLVAAFLVGILGALLAHLYWQP